MPYQKMEGDEIGVSDGPLYRKGRLCVVEAPAPREEPVAPSADCGSIEPLSMSSETAGCIRGAFRNL